MPGDVVLIQYASKTTPGTYRLGRVLSVEEDRDKLVRTCVVRYHLCNGDISKKGTPKDIRVPVQRLVLILPVEEQETSSNGFDEPALGECDWDQCTTCFFDFNNLNISFLTG